METAQLQPAVDVARESGSQLLGKRQSCLVQYVAPRQPLYGMRWMNESLWLMKGEESRQAATALVALLATSHVSRAV